MVFKKGHTVTKETINKIKNSNYHSSLKNKKNQKAICLFCGKDFLRNSERTPLQIYCSKGCTDKSYKRNNSEVINKRNRNYNKNNPLIYQEHIFVMHNKEEINEIIGKRCALCNNKGQAHHLSYLNLPHNNLKEYSKFLMPLCSKHHSTFHQIMNKYGGIEQ